MQLRATRLTAIASAVRKLFSPASLFAAGEQGVWYDPSDMSTMFQDAAGTTPVTAVEQPVGLILDKSRGLVLGPELVTNGTFDSNVNGWTSNQGQAPVWSAGVLRLSTQGTNGTTVLQAISCVVGRVYTVSLSYRVVSGDGLGPGLRISTSGVDFGASGQIYRSPSETPAAFVTRTTVFTATQSTIYVYLIASGGGTVTSTYDFDNISVRELPGNHATQTTATSRPVLSARVNLLTATETLATQTVTTRATTQTFRFEGAGTVTLSGTATGTYSAGSHSITTTAGNLTLTVSGTVTKADLRSTNMGVGLPAYQRVNTSTDYDTAGFPMYLRFDGVDDFLVTPSIDFTGTNKMTVFAGVRKLSDGTGYGRIVDLAQSTANRNNFILTAPWDPNTGSYGMQTNGSGASVQGYIASGFSAPISSVITSQHDIALSATTGAVRMRINKVAQNLQTTGSTTGGGTFTNNSLFIGRGSIINMFQLNACLYSLIVRGAQSTAQQISDTETWVNQRTGAY